MDAVIVGAGPAGCRTAEAVAKKGYEVLVLEEHPKIGMPVQCTGLVSEKIGDVPKKIVLNKAKRAKFCCGDVYFEIKSKRPMLLLDRGKYDVWMAENAEKAGADIRTSAKFLKFEKGKVSTNRGNFQTKILVGADGPNSLVAKNAGIKLPENLIFGVQVRLESRFDPDEVELWFGSDIAPSSFAWVVPEDESVARIGLMTEKNPNTCLEKFLKKRFGRIEAKDRIGDSVRYGLIEKSVADNVVLVGDAACQVKPFSLGGLVYNKMCAEIAGSAIVKSLEQNDFSKKFLSRNYDERWKEKLSWPIKKGLLFKWIFSQISDMPFIFSMIKILNLTKIADFMDIDFLEK